MRFFCYPSGRFNAIAEAAVRQAGFLAATTTQDGLSSPDTDNAAEPRIRVDAGESPTQVLRSIQVASVTQQPSTGE